MSVSALQHAVSTAPWRPDARRQRGTFHTGPVRCTATGEPAELSALTLYTLSLLCTLLPLSAAYRFRITRRRSCTLAILTLPYNARHGLFPPLLGHKRH